MNQLDQQANSRQFPGFLAEWQKANGPEFTPLDYLGWGGGIEFVLAAQWLFCPSFIQHRGGVFFSKFPEGSSEPRRKNIDGWFSGREDRVDLVEFHANMTTLWDVFTNDDTAEYDEDLSQLARTIAECWKSLLEKQFPERDFTVEVHDDDKSYGPQITFYSKRVEKLAAVVHDLPPGQFAPISNEPATLHVDLPPSLLHAFTQLAPGAQVQQIDVRTGMAFDALVKAITPTAESLDQALLQSPTTVVLVTGFEQQWVKNRQATEQFIQGLPTALAAAGSEGKTMHIGLADLTSDTVNAVLALLRTSTTTESEPIPVFHYPPAV
ncbi:hypothetical protein OU415_26060 [Saccharopolyspora sp. WRP15-2]|uniref:Uncharacterized protein n=1 Tax=Saccharopolyspora oryzae TaxID=2997343 RepID=A0ABT4V4N0_9PSEU|nr:hypothetical protein [Saccharopolyspora oryzae]MDA3628925.1 hypothetical protein [Saccharopolyspora oryzae]